MSQVLASHWMTIFTYFSAAGPANYN